MAEFWCQTQNCAQLSHFNPSHKKDILHQSLWYNRYIKINSRPVFIKTWHSANVNKVKDLLTVNGDLMSCENFNCKYNLNVNFYTSLMFYMLCLPVGNRKYSYPLDKITFRLIIQSFLNINYDENDIQNSLSKLYAASISTKVRSFQFRLLHRILGIKAKLHKWGIVESKMFFSSKNDEK